METELVSMAQQFTGLPMDSLIGTPLMAAATANQKMGIAQVKFMIDSCFNKIDMIGNDGNVVKDKAGNALTAYSPIMLQMSLTRGVITAIPPKDPPDANAKTVDIQNVTATFNLPMLTIIPLNSLAVDNVSITFDMEVKSSYAEEQKDTKENALHVEASFDAKYSNLLFSANFHAGISYDHKDSSTHDTHYEKSNSAKYHVEVHAGQLPLPPGVQVIIQAFAGAIQPIMLPAQQNPSKTLNN